MTNYNDGKWHGWNGGECPVHPDTVVKVVTEYGTCITDKAKNLEWNRYDNNHAAFRVVIEYREPVVTHYNGECWAYHFVNQEPTTLPFNAEGDCIHGTWNATHVDGKLQSFTWTADE